MALAKDGQLNLEAVPSEGVRSSDCFTKLEQIGEGTYGQVYKARDNETGEIVALKKVRMDNEKEGFPITAIREIKILKKLNDNNIVKLKEIVTQKDSGAQQNKAKGSIYMVFEYMDHDLTGLTDRNDVKFALPQIKCYLKQLLTGLHFCHTNQVLHRDIKGSNLLINNEGILKLADFGLARNFSSDKDNPAPLTNRVITLWYRPPELLLGATKYGPAIDMWSVGCIFAELLYGKPILPGKNEVDQFQRIMELCGSPTEDNWPGYQDLPWAKQWTDAVPRRPRKLRHVFRNFTPDALELVERLLTLDPEKRGTAAEALDANFFWTHPLPCEPKDLPQYEASHEYQTKKRRQQARQQQDEARHRTAPPAQQGQHAPHAHPPRQGQPPHKQQHPLQQQPQPAYHPPQYAHRPMAPPPVYAAPVPAPYVAPGQYYTAPPQQYGQPAYAGTVGYGRGAPGYGPPGAVQQMPGGYPPQGYPAVQPVAPFMDVDGNHATMVQASFPHTSSYRPPMQQDNRNYRQQR